MPSDNFLALPGGSGVRSTDRLACSNKPPSRTWVQSGHHFFDVGVGEQPPDNGEQDYLKLRERLDPLQPCLTDSSWQPNPSRSAALQPAPEFYRSPPG